MITTTEYYLTSLLSNRDEPLPTIFTFKSEGIRTPNNQPNLWPKVVDDKMTHNTITSNWEHLGLGITTNIQYVLYEIYRADPIDDERLITFVTLCPEENARVLLFTYLVNFNMISLGTYNRAMIKTAVIDAIHGWDLHIFGMTPNTSPILRNAPWIPIQDSKVETVSDIVDAFKDGTLVFERLNGFERIEWARGMTMYGVEYCIVESTKLEHNHLFKGLYTHQYDVVVNVCKFRGIELDLSIDSLEDRYMTIEVFDIHLNNALYFGKKFEFGYWFKRNVDAKLFNQMMLSVAEMSKDKTHSISTIDPFWIETRMLSMSKRCGFETVFDQPIVNNWLTLNGCSIYKHMTIDQRVATFADSSNLGNFKREYTLFDI